IGCAIAAWLDPLLTWWGAVGAFIRAWWWVAFGAACMALGAHLGPARTWAVITAGIVALAVRFWPQKADEPDYETDYETGEPVPPPKPKRKTLADLFGR